MKGDGSMNVLASLAGQYENLVFYNRIMTFKLVLWAVWTGIIIGIAVSYYTKDYLGRFVRRLLKNEALSKEKAMTFEELGYKRTFPLCIHLKDGGTLRRYIDIANEEEAVFITELSPKRKKLRSLFGLSEVIKKYDFSKLRFFIPEEKKYAADVRYEKKGSNPGVFIFWVIALTGLALLVNFLVPELLTMLDNFITIVRNAL